MPTWGEILAELNITVGPNGAPDWDAVRRKYLVQLQQLTGRNTILYASAWIDGGGEATAIGLVDVQGLMEVFRGMPGPSLDLILHSPGGSPEATASVVRYMRSKYDDVRVFVPLAAMSAATMWAMAADAIVMGKHSQLGPIDPQMIMGQRLVPARALLAQFERAARECSEDPSRLSAWLPTLQQYPPGLLEQCQTAEDLGKELVKTWLAKWMFKDRDDGDDQAAAVADYLSGADIHKSHAMGISREQARELGLNIHDLEDDPALQDAVLSVHHATMHTFQGAAIKIIENHLGSAFVQMGGQVIPMPMPIQLPPSPAPVPTLMPPTGPDGAPATG